jgi:hypothetical protein
MTISKDLFLSILSMDSYNRGYGAGITGLSDAKNTQIGNASISLRIQDIDDFSTSAEDAGFYALSYDTQYGQVISYRGTDNVDPFTWNPGASDLWNGWVFGAGPVTSQIKLAQAFYEAATGTDVFSSDGNAILTSHSLGGGLAGPVISLKGYSGAAASPWNPGYQIPNAHR